MRQLNRLQSIAFFVAPGAVVFAAFEWIYAPLLLAGAPEAWAVFGCLWVPVLFMTAAILVRWRRSGLAFGDFFLARRLGRRAALASLAALAAVQLLELLLEPSRAALASIPGLEVPIPFPELVEPGFTPEIPLQRFLGLPVPGNPWVLAFWALWLVPNILGEELLWRGYALPRMEEAWGRYAWLVNGLLWNFGFHFFMRWSCLVLLPISILLPWLAWHCRSWEVGILVHGLGNALMFALLVPSVLAGP